MQLIERFVEHYEVQEVPFGRIYKWCPECLVLECECHERVTFHISDLTQGRAVCACGADLTSEIQEMLQEDQPEVWGQMLEDYEVTHHPWLYDARAQAEQHLRDEAACT